METSDDHIEYVVEDCNFFYEASRRLWILIPITWFYMGVLTMNETDLLWVILGLSIGFIVIVTRDYLRYKRQQVDKT